MKNQVINQIINFFWTILCFVPVIYYWAYNYSVLLYGLILFSLVFAFLPASIFSRLQLSTDKRFYEKCGVKLIQKLVQNGTYANRAVNKNDPQYKVVKNRAQAQNYLNTIAMYERYHLSCFIFFSITFIHALYQQQFVVATLILAANIIYNVCPLLLQQYNKLKVLRLLSLTKP